MCKAFSNCHYTQNHSERKMGKGMVSSEGMNDAIFLETESEKPPGITYMYPLELSSRDFPSVLQIHPMTLL